MEIRTTSLLFPEQVDSGPATAETELSFPRDVNRVAAGITGYTVQFENRDDHELGRLEVEVRAQIDSSDATKVTVTGRLGLRDWSNEFDDPYSGLIDVAVLADLVAVTAPGPGAARGDLLIVGAEVTQAVQHFRSGDHLDVPNVFPDNSIRLIAGKPTVVRLYVDYDAGSGLPLISTLSGSVTLSTGAGSVTLAPIESVAPRRDVSIDRGVRRHTLNFLLRDTQSVGEVDLVATVFDAFAATTEFSPPFARTLRFDQQPMLAVLAVGIEYTGDDVVDGAAPADLLAPTEVDFVDTLEFTDRVYPIPGVVITDYRTMTYDGDLRSDIADGCDKLSELKDAVVDFVGDSDDIVYGLFGTGVDTGSVSGCGGGGVGVGRVLSGGTAAHEIGHALGRRHAPCDNVTRCATPRNTDDDYPAYSGYDSDSIGEFGFDPTTSFGTVKDPATAHDLMGYSPDDWISPYTYKALMGAIPGSSLGGARERTVAIRARDHGEWIAVKQPKLFLRLDLERDGPVLHPSFHFDARPRIATGSPTDYVFELRDDDDRVLRRECLVAEDSGCGCGCDGAFQVRVRQAVAFDPRARSAVLLDCDSEIGRWDVPPAPEVEVSSECDDDDPAAMWLAWTVRADEGVVEPGGGHWALVQWRDRHGTWRGIGPRTRQTRLRVPRRIALMGGEVHYRVLVTTGIATGVGHCDDDCGPGDPPALDPSRLVIVGAPRGSGTHELPRLIRAATVGDADRGRVLRWYTSGGGELSRGGLLDLARLPRGRTAVTASLIGAGAPTPTAQWLLERTVDDRFLLHVGQVGGNVPGVDDDPHRDHDHNGRRHHRPRRGQDHPHAHGQHGDEEA